MCKLIHTATNLLTKIIFIPHINNLNHIFLCKHSKKCTHAGISRRCMGESTIRPCYLVTEALSTIISPFLYAALSPRCGCLEIPLRPLPPEPDIRHRLHLPASMPSRPALRCSALLRH